MAHGLSGTRRDRPRRLRRALRRRRLRRARLRPPRLRRQRRRARPLPAPAPARGLGGGDRLRPFASRASTPAGSRPSAPRWAAATRSPRRRPTAGRRRDQPGPLPRHASPGAPLAARVVAADDAARPARGRHLPAVGQPDEAAFINAPGAEAGWRRVVAIGEDSRWRNRVSSRWLLGSRSASARSAARALHCPWLVCVGEADRVARPAPAIAAAQAGPARRAAHLSRRRPLRHLRRPRARGGRRRSARVPRPPPRLSRRRAFRDGMRRESAVDRPISLLGSSFGLPAVVFSAA